MGLGTFLLLLLVFFYVSGSLVEQFRQYVFYDGKACLNGEVFAFSHASIFQCTKFCMEYGPNCKGVSFKRTAGTCRGCSAYSFGDLRAESDSFIYKRVTNCIDETLPDDSFTYGAGPWLASYLVCPTVIAKVNNGYIGVWGIPAFCPVGKYAIGFALKAQPHQAEGDDTAVNAVTLYCSSLSGTVAGGETIMLTNNGPNGDWLPTVYCNSGRVLKAFRIRVESTDPVDNVGLSDMEFQCGDLLSNDNIGILVSNSVGNDWGDWGDWSVVCGPGQAICGFMARVLEDQGEEDDTALNDVVTFCC